MKLDFLIIFDKPLCESKSVSKYVSWMQWSYLKPYNLDSGLQTFYIFCKLFLFFIEI